MCGITGFIDLKRAQTRDEQRQCVEQMVRAIEHRGPDDWGVYLDPDGPVVLGHARLSIIDLTAVGRQPMRSSCGRYVMTYNGELYNYVELKQQLLKLGCQFSTQTDTEVLLQAIAQWGLDEALAQGVGMFAFALYDRQLRRLYLVRDRLGIKPLYYSVNAHGLQFASELKALLRHPQFDAALDEEAARDYFCYGYVPAPKCIYRHARKLLPGHYLAMDIHEQSLSVTDKVFWRAPHDETKHDVARSAEDHVEAVAKLVDQAVTCRMRAHVHVGCFLSGGVDSSLISAVMQSHSDRPINTFSIGFPHKAYDESQHARAVAQHLGTRHHELMLQPGDIPELLEKMPDYYDEPFADSSQLPMLLVSRLARSQIKVCLSGDGGDELFVGYNRYLYGARLWRLIQRVPHALRAGLAKVLLAVNPVYWDRLGIMMALLPRAYRVNNLGDKLHKLGWALTSGHVDELYQQLASHGRGAQILPMASGSQAWRASRQTKHVAQLMADRDLLGTLPDDILVKVDRASMAVGLEARVPLLDHRLVEYVQPLPMDMKVRGQQTKWLLRQLLYRYVPEPLVTRPKQGFSVPLDNWFRGALRPWAESLLADLERHNPFGLDTAKVRMLWRDHLRGRRNWQHPLWSIMMMQQWCRRFL